MAARGGFFSAGGGAGVNVGSSAQIGAYRGDILNGGLRGTLVNTGAGVGPLGAQGSFTTDGTFVGGLVSFGPRAPVPVFGNTSITDTSVFSLRQDVTNVFNSLLK